MSNDRSISKPTQQLSIGRFALWALAALVAGCGGGTDRPPVVGGEDPTSPRLTVENNCGDDVWLISTPPGDKAAVRAQWDWLLNRADQRNDLPNNGGTVAALLLRKGESKTFDVPDKGAPGGNFRFYMGCPGASDSQPGGRPFDLAGCIIGSVAGDLSAINTLFEPTFGCKPGLAAEQCAFNPSGDPNTYPNCRDSPGAGNCPPLASADNFDLSAVDGYTLPMKVEATPQAGKRCNRNATDAGMLDLASCPGEDATTLVATDSSQQALIQNGIGLLTRGESLPGKPLRACSAPFHWFETNTLGSPPSPIRGDGSCDPKKGPLPSQCFYAGAGCDEKNPVKGCPGRSGPQQRVGPNGDGTLAIQNTHWVQNLYGLGYKGYTWQYGDGVGDQTCDWGEQIKLTLCPAGGVPYRSGQLWAFSAATGTCASQGAVGAANNTTTFASLADCQAANMRYTCDDQTDEASFNIPSAMWKADPAATLAGTGYTPVQVAGLRRLVCADRVINVPGFGNLTLPGCNYVYGQGDATCP